MENQTIFNNKELLHWFTGIVEGEGYLSFQMKKTPGGDDYAGYRISVNMNDKDIIQRLHDAVPGSKMSGECDHGKWHKPHWSTFYRFNIHKRSIVKDTLVAMLPILGDRRSKRANEILLMMEKYPPLPKWRHGTRQGYEFHKCRCDLCREANNARHRKQRAKRKAKKESTS